MLFHETEEGKTHMVRQIDPRVHIDSAVLFSIFYLFYLFILIDDRNSIMLLYKHISRLVYVAPRLLTVASARNIEHVETIDQSRTLFSNTTMSKLYSLSTSSSS